MQVLTRGVESQVEAQSEIENDEMYDVTFKNKFSCQETEIQGKGFVCKNRAFLIFTLSIDLLCGEYILIFDGKKKTVIVR